MPLTDGTRLGSYQIVGPLGAGGMGEVYRATDTRLKRQVAIKTMPPAVAADPDRLARFQREAEVLASLNHPYIAAIYGFEDTAGTKALVMELVEGPTLADRLARGGPIPIDEALPIARQIAEALEAAHERGIIHRDLKPANIKVRDDGTVKVLDFGLAKLADADGVGRSAAGGEAADAATITSPAAMTAMGLILGTAAYMSPEQARGRAVDKRTDVWAFGAVLYEMLAGTRAFEGEDIADTIASVVKSTPDWTKLPTDVPPHIVTLVQRCLEKDRQARIGDIAVARFLLSDHARSISGFAIASGVVTSGLSSQSGPAAASTIATSSVATTTASTDATTPPRWRQVMPWVLAVAGLAFVWLMPRQSTTTALPLTHLQMDVAPAEYLVHSDSSVRPGRLSMAIAPDGRRVVFAATRGTTAQLYVRAFDQAAAAPIAGTEGASQPFFSADGAWIGFWVDNLLKKVPSAGGPAATICEIPRGNFPWGATWGDDNTIVFSTQDGIAKVSSGGGTPTTLTTRHASKDERHVLPFMLPGSKAILFTTIASTDWDTAAIVLLSLDSGQQRVLLRGGADARYVDTGHLVYIKAGTMMAVPFDLPSLSVTGPPVALLEGVMQAGNMPNGGDESGAGQFAVASGTLLYVPGGLGPPRLSELVWADRAGTVQKIAAAPVAPYLSPRLSPDGQKIVVAVRHMTNRGGDLWVYDAVRGAPTRLTFDGVSGMPIWSSDGKRVLYPSADTGQLHLTAINADGSGKREHLVTSDRMPAPSSTASTGAIAFLQRPAADRFGIWVMSGEGDRKPTLFLDSTFTLYYPELSPDGRWIAYASKESGTIEIYVQPYPGPGEKVRISSDGGFEPLWTPNGRELLFRAYVTGKHQVLSAAIRSVAPFRADAPRVLFEVPTDTFDLTTPTRSWDIAPDGQRFLLVRPTPSTDKPVSAVQVVLNWTDELKRRVPAK
jgi:eukaryotic-like serine/threonine-protein kinase